jgi:hypothetical protein
MRRLPAPASPGRVVVRGWRGTRRAKTTSTARRPNAVGVLRGRRSCRLRRPQSRSSHCSADRRRQAASSCSAPRHGPEDPGGARLVQLVGRRHWGWRPDRGSWVARGARPHLRRPGGGDPVAQREAINNTLWSPPGRYAPRRAYRVLYFPADPRRAVARPPVLDVRGRPAPVSMDQRPPAGHARRR